MALLFTECYSIQWLFMCQVGEENLHSQGINGSPQQFVFCYSTDGFPQKYSARFSADHHRLCVCVPEKQQQQLVNKKWNDHFR